MLELLDRKETKKLLHSLKESEKKQPIVLKLGSRIEYIGFIVVANGDVFFQAKKSVQPRYMIHITSLMSGDFPNFTINSRVDKIRKMT